MEIEICCHFFFRLSIFETFKTDSSFKIFFLYSLASRRVFLFVGHWHSYFFELPLFPKHSLENADSRASHPKRGCRVIAELIKVCEMVWGHLMTLFLTQRECKWKLEILIQFTQNHNAHKNIILRVLWVFFFFSFQYRMNSILLNSTFIVY